MREIKESTESRKDWMPKRFEFAAISHKRNGELQFWTHEMSNLQTKHLQTKIANSITPKIKISDENHAVELLSHSFTCQKMAYIHENPLRSGWVEKAEDWKYSSQRNDIGLECLLEIDVADI